jgi:ABC-type uncharacterized transport system substrate-binding protein
VRQALQGAKATLEIVYLDAKRDPDPERLRARAKALFERIVTEKPQVVIAADDAAQEYLVAPYLKGRAAPQVIFCGVNAPLAHYGFPAANVSGVRERWHFGEGFALLKRIDPKLRSVAVLFDDSETGGYLLNDLREDAQAGPFALKLVGAEAIHTFQQWQRRVEYYQRRADALAFGLYHSLVDETTGQVVPAETVIAWSNAANRLPTLGFADFAKEHGMLCGVLGAGKEQGLLAGAMARQVLERGVKAGALPVRRNQKGEVLVNLKTAQRLGIDIPYAIIDAAGFVIK